MKQYPRPGGSDAPDEADAEVGACPASDPAVTTRARS